MLSYTSLCSATNAIRLMDASDLIVNKLTHTRDTRSCSDENIFIQSGKTTKRAQTKHINQSKTICCYRR